MNHDARLARALKEIRVRFASDAEGMLIAQMVHCSHEAVPNVAWDKVYPNWEVAEWDGEIIGCVQLCYSTPIARMELLSFVPNLPYRTRALAVKALLTTAEIALKRYGAQAIAGCVPFEQRSFKAILKGEGCSVIHSGNIVGRTLTC